MEKALFNTLIEQHAKGKRADSGWKAEAWIAVQLAIEIKYTGGVSFTVDQCKSKYETVISLFTRF